jgi:hypothetical protein
MKKIYVLTLLLALSCWVSAQTFVTEDFSGGTMPPAGWSIDAYATNWSVESSGNAGGIAPEAQFYYDPSFTAASRLISPPVDLTGITSIKLMFKHFLDDYAGAGYSIGVATRSGGGSWNIVWTVNPTGDIGPEEKIVAMSVPLISSFASILTGILIIWIIGISMILNFLCLIILTAQWQRSLRQPMSAALCRLKGPLRTSA